MIQDIADKGISLFTKADYHYYSFDLDNIDHDKIQLILEKCKEVEDRCWNSESDFFEYIKTSSRLCVAIKDNELVGFILMRHWQEDNMGLLELQEIMILPEHQGFNIGKKLGYACSCIVYEHYKQIENIKRVGIIALSTSSKGIIYNKLISRFTRFNSFSKPVEVVRVANNYVGRNGYTLIDEGNPFFIKGAFPNSGKSGEQLKVKKRKILDQIFPENFDSTDRGDAMLLILLIPKNALLKLVVRLIILKQFGFKFKGA